MNHQYDYDYLVIGSGFGGSVSALRLAEKGYRVGVLESGRRFEDHDFAERLSQLRRTIFAPKLGLKGILRVTPFKDVMILSGSVVPGTDARVATPDAPNGSVWRSIACGMSRRSGRPGPRTVQTGLPWPANAPVPGFGRAAERSPRAVSSSQPARLEPTTYSRNAK